jgi:hypothetical protein
MPEAGKEAAVINFLGRDRRSSNVKNNISAGLVERPEENPCSSYPPHIGEGEGDVVHLDLLWGMIFQDGRRALGNQVLQYPPPSTNFPPLSELQG